VPVTAKLSKLFYERLGEQITNELVEWFNTVDATYRSDLRELNELNFARFDAKLEQRIAELRSELLAEIRTSIPALRTELKTEYQTGLHAVRTDLHALKADLVKWMFLFWAGTALAGLLLR
jgi:hypothetical protein